MKFKDCRIFNKQDPVVVALTSSFRKLLATRLIWRLTLSVKDDSDDEAIDTQDTRHDNWNDGLEDKVGLEDTHWANADAWLSGSIGSAEIYKNTWLSFWFNLDSISIDSVDLDYSLDPPLVS